MIKTCRVGCIQAMQAEVEVEGINPSHQRMLNRVPL